MVVAPARRAIPTTAGMSMTRRSGFEMVSTKTTRGRADWISRSKAGRSVAGANLVSTPSGVMMSRKSAWVAP